MFGLVSAEESFENIPTQINLKCGESYSETFNFNSTVNYTMGSSDSLVNYQLALTKTSPNFLQISLFPKPNYICYQGQSFFDFTVNSVKYNITLNITEDYWDLGLLTVSEGEEIEVGGLIDFKVQTTDDDKIRFLLSGCNNNKDDFLTIGQDIEVLCDGDTIKFQLESAFTSPFSFAKIRVLSSESGFNIIQSETEEESNECILGLDTLGVTIKRGNIFAIKTINSESGKYEDSVIVRVLDQAGEIEPLNGFSSNVGYFGQRLAEEYKEDLIVQLEKEGCEPYTNVLFFDRSYNDYLELKEDEENKNTLQIIFEDSTSRLIKGIVSNKLNESIEGASVKITSPSGISQEFTTDTNGKFNYDADELGEFKLQAGKPGYTSSELINYTIKSDSYVVVKFVNGKEVSEFKKDEVITFKIMDNENKILPLTFDATIDDKQISFIDGVSEDFIFEKEVKLEIPEISGYDSERITLHKKKLDNWIYYLIGGIIILILVIVLLSKNKKEETKIPMMVGQD